MRNRAFKPCLIEGCDGDAGKKGSGRGWCPSHHYRWKRHGDPLSGGTPWGSPMRWLHDVALKYEDRESCLIWPYSTTGTGYGHVRINGRNQIVSRVVCEHRNGPPPTPEHEAAHSCGKGHEGCCNPWHLDWKTHTENCADRVEHDTHDRGERHPLAKLKESDVLEIRCLLLTDMTHREIADRFGVSHQNIGFIATGRRWAWLNEVEVADENAS